MAEAARKGLLMHGNRTSSYSPRYWEEAELNQELDRLVELAWEPGWAPVALGGLMRLCATLRQNTQDWMRVRHLLRSHPTMRRLMQEDPWVFHAARPTAVRLDLLLGHPAAAPLLADASRAGRDLFAVTSALPWANALRNRKALLTRMVDAVAADVAGASILTLDAGHLREAAEVTGLGSLSRWVVLEEDAEHRQVMRQGLPPGLSLQMLRCSLRSFARRSCRRGRFDLICIPRPPLFWPPSATAELVSAAFEVLKPGGRLLLCAPGAPVPEAAWMDAYLERTPRWTTPREMEALLAEVDPEACASRQVFPSLDGHMMHAILRRRG
jgi:SAM-dependent methyltransferase